MFDVFLGAHICGYAGTASGGQFDRCFGWYQLNNRLFVFLRLNFEKIFIKQTFVSV